MAEYIDKAIAVKGLRMAHDLDGADFVSNIPAADVRENVLGEWREENPSYLDGDSIYVCSACGETWTLVEGTPKENNMNYCPNCGAKMVGGAEDG